MNSFAARAAYVKPGLREVAPDAAAVLAALPVGCVVLLISLIFFATLWLRRQVSGG